MSGDYSAMHIVGLGVASRAQLSAEAQHALMNCDQIYGSVRQLATIAHYLENHRTQTETTELPKLTELEQKLRQRGAKKIVILASGDPLFYGIGRWLGQQFLPSELVFYPAISSVQAACHRLGLSLQDTTVLSLHGRPPEILRTALKAKSTVVILTDKNSQPARIAQECSQAGYTRSRITVCENLGYTSERVRNFPIHELIDGQVTFDPLHITIVQVEGQSSTLPQFPGFADVLFETGSAPGSGMISKREVRLQILSYLQAANDDVVWDIGAGCGGVAIELAYWNARTTVYAIEQHPQRLQYLQENRRRFGVVSNLKIKEGRAPACLAELPAPDKIFIGGSDGELAALLDQAWSRLPINGVLVASAVMESTRHQLSGFAEAVVNARVESVILAVKRGTVSGNRLSYKDKLPVEIFSFTKTGDLP
ncbi:precorrin-6y C5,15-methyltransferase (decarboxylating) subunit CbiE [Ketobacter sp. MCCC 1A13808]|uniref:precorrin-6y C5,15-methyltransferase (decarboxylating) subunit CbiE n=1 Tax=Ketobacter sp. MCCC 1A13808 TaxID=2602738 RepID=UPI000F2D5B63|nr:precorrin-6y C5,15-methyltransferase (decarboxylating) subunit CbiE [Ketobacter sp. MCCC 1A13808]MVF13625.1 precorrin-6y C5,15-methyltransferase (decarboxylating) subunit CbiE [Ketobacter sp. MCCC 1A13808]RLP53124.1 MAG: precorrin-6y C5,15-methyltransferase (decarboxylating) subunit CbiE [Ketobacter sp.]